MGHPSPTLQERLAEVRAVFSASELGYERPRRVMDRPAEGVMNSRLYAWGVSIFDHQALASALREAGFPPVRR